MVEEFFINDFGFVFLHVNAERNFEKHDEVKKILINCDQIDYDVKKEVIYFIRKFWVFYSKIVCKFGNIDLRVDGTREIGVSGRRHSGKWIRESGR